MTAAERLAELDSAPAHEICARTEAALTALADVMNRETGLIRAGHHKEAAALMADKARLAQAYAGHARTVQRELTRLTTEAPEALQALRAGHERLVTQMAENLRVLATARAVTDDLLSDVAQSVTSNARPQTYGASGTLEPGHGRASSGLAVNRAL